MSPLMDSEGKHMHYRIVGQRSEDPKPPKKPNMRWLVWIFIAILLGIAILDYLLNMFRGALWVS